ncbi:MAG: FG-GAP-like repeat-containing protein [Candidatus Latescibacterota bacterium]
MNARAVTLAAAAGLAPCGPAGGQPYFADAMDSLSVGGFAWCTLAWGDYDNDGWPDLFLSEVGGDWVAMGHSEGGRRYADRTGAVLPQAYGGLKGGGAVFGDYDNDGDLDLFVSIGAGLSRQRDLNLLLRNDRGVYTNVNREAGLTDSLPTHNAIWLDYDRDGYLDLYTGNLADGNNVDADPTNDSDPTTRNKLYRNRGDGTFADVTADVGLDVQLHPGWGGTNGGMTAADLNDDGWPDLYVGVWGDRNRLFLSDGQGGFREATTDEVDDEGHDYDVTVGDIDNDGDLDLFQAVDDSRPVLLLNLGGADFADVTESAGLWGSPAAQPLGTARFGDVDNDGDLDLLTGWPAQVFLNDGSGFFAAAPEGSSGLAANAWFPALADYDRDGFLDAAFGFADMHSWRFGGLYHNQGNGNHWLEVELVGVQSNRNGIGARVLATAGSARQTREILAGQGWCQDEVMAHFGLGERTRVDELEVRWPSGQVDVLAGVPADQRIRLFEGGAAYWPVTPFAAAMPDSVVAGGRLEARIDVQPALFGPGAAVRRATADLSALGATGPVPLLPAADGTYGLRALLGPVPGPNGLRQLSVDIEQSTGLGTSWAQVSRSVVVVPAADLVILDEGLGPGWALETTGAMRVDPAATGPARRGSRLASLHNPGTDPWTVRFHSQPGVCLVGYRLRFAFRSEGATGRSLLLTLNTGRSKRLLPTVDLAAPGWQEVEFPPDSLGLTSTDTLSSLTFSGSLAGTFYLDDIRLVAARPSRPATAVVETQARPVPQAFGLQPNYPNPFNGSTVIRFGLPARGPVELAVYNLAGQRVATLVRGERGAGTHAVTWDGRAEDGRPLATGVYLCHLRTGGQASGRVQTRKLLLVR